MHGYASFQQNQFTQQQQQPQQNAQMTQMQQGAQAHQLSAEQVQQLQMQQLQLRQQQQQQANANALQQQQLQQQFGSPQQPQQPAQAAQGQGNQMNGNHSNTLSPVQQSMQPQGMQQNANNAFAQNQTAQANGNAAWNQQAQQQQQFQMQQQGQFQQAQQPQQQTNVLQGQTQPGQLTGQGQGQVQAQQQVSPQLNGQQQQFMMANGQPQQQFMQQPQQQFMQQPQQAQQQFMMQPNQQQVQPNQQEQQPEASAIDVEQSTLRVVAPEFNPTSVDPAVTQATIQEQLFTTLQTLQQQTTALTLHNAQLQPQLLQTMQSIQVYQANPQLLQDYQHQMQYYQLQQQQAVLAQQINVNNLTLQQLQLDTATTRDAYQRNKDEQYVVPIDPNEENQQGAMQMGMGMQMGMQMGNTIALNDRVTDVGGGPVMTQAQQPLNGDAHGHAHDPNAVVRARTPESGDGDADEEAERVDPMDVHVDAYAEQTQPTHDTPLGDTLNTQHIDQQRDQYPLHPQHPVHEPKDDEDVDVGEEEEEQVEDEPEGDPNAVIAPMRTFSSRFRSVNSTGNSSLSAFGADIVTSQDPSQSPHSVSAASPSRSNDGYDANDDFQSPVAPVRQSSMGSNSSSGSGSLSSRSLPRSRLGSRMRLLEPEHSGSSMDSHSPSMEPVEEGWEEDEEKHYGTQRLNPEGESTYSVKELIVFQKKFLDIRWREFPDIPRSVRMITHGINNEKYMEDVVAMFRRRLDRSKRYEVRAASSKKEKLFKQLTGVLNKMTPEKFDKIALATMEIVNKFAATEPEMNDIIGLVLQFGIKQPVFGGQYAKLCSHLHAHLPKLGMISDYQWIVQDPDVSKTFRKMVIRQTNDLFTMHRNHSPHPEPTMSEAVDGKEPQPLDMDAEAVELRVSKRKQAFFAVMVLVAELYNVDLVKSNLVFKGVFQVVLKSDKQPEGRKLNEVDLEGLCRLLKRCGSKLDAQKKEYVDHFLQKLSSHSRKFDFRTKVLVDEVKEMRRRGWKHRLKKEVAKTLDEIHEEARKEQAQFNKGGRKGGRRDDRGRGGDRRDRRDDRRDRGRGGGGRDRGGRGDYYEDDYRDDRRRDDRYRDDRGRKSRRESGGSNGRYKVKNSPEKSGVYQKKDSPRIVGGSSKKTGSAKKFRLLRADNNNPSAKPMPSGRSADPTGKLRRRIDEYIVTGVIDEIVDLEVTDLRVWRAVINDGLRDRKSSEIHHLIRMVEELFDAEVLSNKGGLFHDSVVKFLASQMDDSSVDCPNFGKYVGQMFAHLYNAEHMVADDLFGVFDRHYRDRSEMPKVARTKRFNKLVRASVEELNVLRCEPQYVEEIQAFELR